MKFPPEGFELCKETLYLRGYYAIKPYRLADNHAEGPVAFESDKSRLERPSDYPLVPYIPKSEADARQAALQREVERLKAIVAAFKHWGTDGCSSCEAGRITLWAANNKCISCDPAGYDKGAPIRAYREALGGPNAEAGE